MCSSIADERPLIIVRFGKELIILNVSGRIHVTILPLTAVDKERKIKFCSETNIPLSIGEMNQFQLKIYQWTSLD